MTHPQHDIETLTKTLARQQVELEDAKERAAPHLAKVEALQAAIQQNEKQLTSLRQESATALLDRRLKEIPMDKMFFRKAVHHHLSQVSGLPKYDLDGQRLDYVSVHDFILSAILKDKPWHAGLSSNTRMMTWQNAYYPDDPALSQDKRRFRQRQRKLVQERTVAGLISQCREGLYRLAEFYLMETYLADLTLASFGYAYPSIKRYARNHLFERCDEDIRNWLSEGIHCSEKFQ